jgi:hypothetical protein
MEYSEFETENDYNEYAETVNGDYEANSGLKIQRAIAHHN